MTENADSNALNEGQSISSSHHNPGVKGTGLRGKFLRIGVTGLLSALGSLGCLAVWASQKADSEMEVGMQSPHLWTLSCRGLSELSKLRRGLIHTQRDWSLDIGCSQEGV